MTERSYFHNGVTPNDALLAPYSAKVFVGVLENLFASEGSFVLPGTLDNLNAQPGAGRSVDIYGGAAFLEGVYYKNAPAYPVLVENIPLDANNSAYPRIDRIVVQLDWESATPRARLAVIKGTPSAIPEPPVINRCTTTVECPLWRVYLPAFYASVSSTFLFDERPFANNAFHANNYSLYNRLTNSDMTAVAMISSGQAVLSGFRVPPAGVALVKFAPPFAPEVGGRALNYNFAASSTDIRLTMLTSEHATDMFTLCLWVWVQKGNLVISWAGKALDVRPSVDPQLIIIRSRTTGYQELILDGTIFDTDGLATSLIGPIALSHGYIPAHMQHEEGEYIALDTAPILSLTGLSSATTTILSNSFPEFVNALGGTSLLLSDIRGVIIQLEVNDSGAAGISAIYAELKPTASGQYLRCYTGGNNDKVRAVTGILYLEKNVFGSTIPFKFELTTVASGAGTMDVKIKIVGVIT